MKILVVDDDEVMRKLLQEVLVKGGYGVHLASSGEEAAQVIRREAFPVIISDIRMLEMDGMAVLREVKRADKRSAVILMTGFGSMEGAIEAIQEGAFDYISKPFKMDELKAIVSRAAKHWESMNSPNPGSATPQFAVSPRAVIGKSPKIVEVYKTLARAAMSSSNVLIMGESGTGKELIARAIHDNSPRRGKRFVAVSCGALAEPMLESELFGHVQGAFPGAVSGKIGLFEEANGGTLFLDEVGDLAPALQVKLLRVIQENEMRPMGASDARQVDVRVIAATHRDFESLVRSGKFREDLYYRLKVIPIEVPPLRERIEDLPELVGFFLAKYAEKNQKAVSHVSDEVMAMLKAYPWPGNIRELEHAIEHAVAMTSTPVLFAEAFPVEIARETGVSSGAPVSVDAAVAGPAGSLEEIERAHIVKVLQDVGFNKSKASEVLGIDRATLYRKAQRYGIDLRGK